MVQVKLWGSLRSLAGDREIVEVEAETLKDVIDGIVAEVPDSWFVPIGDAKEIVMMPRMVGG